MKFVINSFLASRAFTSTFLRSVVNVPGPHICSDSVGYVA